MFNIPITLDVVIKVRTENQQSIEEQPVFFGEKSYQLPEVFPQKQSLLDKALAVPRPFFSPEDDDLIRSLQQQGFNWAEVSKKLNRSHASIKARAKILGLTNTYKKKIKTIRKPYSKEEMESIIRYTKEGRNPAEIAELLDRKIQSIHSFLKSNSGMKMMAE